MSAVELKWKLETDRDGQGIVIDPETVLPHGKNVIFILENLSPDVAVMSGISANGADTTFIGKSNGVHNFIHAVAGPSMLALRVWIGTVSPQTTSATPPTVRIPVGAPEPSTIEGGITVGMRRTTSRMTEDVPLWVSIRKGTVALGFDRYFDFMNWVFCTDGKSHRWLLAPA